MSNSTHFDYSKTVEDRGRQPPRPANPGKRRVIGPIAPRDKSGRLLLAPLLDSNGVEIERDPRDLMGWEQNQRPDPAAIKGLKLYEVDLDREPLLQVYARNAEHALDVWKFEYGITKIGNDVPPPIVTEVK